MTLVLERETFQVRTTFVEKSDPYADYLAGGGRLTQEYHQYIRSFHPGAEIDQVMSDGSYRSSWHQASGMREHAGIDLSDEETYLYMVLRNLPVTPNPPVEDLGRRPQSLSDQVLLAEILRITNQDKFATFTAAYPVIFPTDPAPAR